MLSRRQFLKLGLFAGVGLVTPPNILPNILPKASPIINTLGDNPLKFIQPLRKIGTDIPLAQKDAVPQPWWQPGVDHYTIDIGQFEDQLHPDFANPTRLFGFGQNYSPTNPGWATHLGGVIAAKRGTPVQITFRNHLPVNHIMPIDSTVMGADLARDRVCVHLHGGLVPWTSDGGPHAWWDPHGNRGPSFLNPLGAPLAANEAEYYYPNDQGSRLLWYHDHAFGNTRINAYAGIASGYVVYDDYEISLITGHNLPGPLDPRTVYLIFQDKMFVKTTTAASDPTWFEAVHSSRPGDLWYKHQYDPADQTPPNPGILPDPSCVPEFFGDTILANGTVFPFLDVEPREYRFRILNACNARFLNPRLVYADDGSPTEPMDPGVDANAGPAFTQIATEGGFLPKPVLLDGKTPETRLVMAPAERADLVIDFRSVPAGSVLILYNDAPAPYPMGDPGNDYYPGNPATPESEEGKAPNTRTLLQIRVKARVGAADPAISLPPVLTPTDPFIVQQTSQVPITDLPAGATLRRLTLNETNDELGRLIQMLGTDNVVVPSPTEPQFGMAYEDAPTEVVQAGAREVWEIVNLTGDTHPIHFHLVNVQVLSRQALKSEPGYIYQGGVPEFTGPAAAPDDNELGWKETVRMNPNEVTRVLMQFTLPKVPYVVPHSPRTGGYEYVWHCHILEHEEHDMMRPLIVKDNLVYLPQVANSAP